MNTLINLDKFGRDINSPAYKNIHSTFQNGMEFDSQTDRNIIDTAKIRDASITNAKIGTAAIGTANIGTLSFNQITGGTATIGGTLNGDGVVSVNNAGGTEVVRLDNTGLIVTSGTITSVAFASGTLNAGTITSSMFSSGTINNAIIGTPLLTGGTVNPSLYRINGTSGVDGSIVYVKSVNFGGSTTTLGTMSFNKGIITSFN